MLIFATSKKQNAMYKLNIKSFIRMKKISQCKMAKDLGWTPTFLSLFINNKTPVTLKNLDKATKYLNLSIFDVLEEVNNEGSEVKRLIKQGK